MVKRWRSKGIRRGTTRPLVPKIARERGMGGEKLKTSSMCCPRVKIRKEEGMGGEDKKRKKQAQFVARVARCEA